MSQDLIVSGDTYEGVERVAATNTKGGLVVYGDGDGEASSPTIAVAPIEGGYRITVTDVAGSRSFDMKNGLSPTINITETPFADANGAGSAIKIACVSKDPVTGEETESSETVYVRNGKNGLHGTDVTLDITRQSGDDPGWWFKKKQTVYNADGTTKVTETTDFLPLVDNASLFIATEETTYTEIKAAYDAGKVCFANNNGAMLTLVNINDTEAMFALQLDPNLGVYKKYTSDGGADFGLIESNAVQYVEQSLSEAQKAQVRANINAAFDNIYFVNFSDATYDEIKAAYDAGKLCFVQYANFVTCYMTRATDEYFMFDSAIGADAALRLQIGSDGTNTHEIIHSSAIMYTAQSLTLAQKEQARKNIGAADAASASKAANAVIVELAGNHTDGYTALLDGEAAIGDTLNELAQAGNVVIGIASGEMNFWLSSGMVYRVPEGTIFRYGNAVVSYEYRSLGFEFYVQMEDNNFALFYQESGWVGKAQPVHIAFYLVPPDSEGKMIRYNGEMLAASDAYWLLFDSMQRSRPVFCYQENAVFYAEDGSKHKPDMYTPFYFNGTDFSFRCEQNGYEYTLLISTSGYTPTAKKTTPYITAESKGDDLKAEDGTLFLLSAGEPIGEGVPIPTGDSNVFVADYDTTTFAEIKAAHDAGKVCFVKSDGMPFCQLLGIDDSEAIFIREINETTDYEVTFTSAGGKNFTLVDKNTPIYVAQTLSDNQKAQARTNIGAAAAADLSKYVTTGTAQTITGVKTFNAPANVAGTEQHTVKFKTSNGGAIIFGKEAANSGTMLRFDQVDGTTRLRFRGSDSAGAIVWEQPEQGAQLYVDLGKQGVDKHRISFPSSGGTLALTSQIPSLSGYLPLSGGLMTGSLKFQAASLPGKTLQYICGVDAFASGGEMGWQSKADFLSGYLTTTGTAAKATADANGNNIANTYAKVTTANDYNGEQRFKNAAYCPTITDTASGIGCAFKASRGMVNELLADKIIATASTGKIPFYSYTGASNGSMTGLTEFAYLSPGAFILRPPSGEGGQIQLEAAANDPTNTGICIDTAGGNFRIFGLQSADGTTTTGYGSVLAIHPYAKAITGGYSFDGIAAKATADGNGNNIASTYLPIGGGTMAGPLWITGGDSATAGKLILNNNGRGQITDSGSSTLFGFVSTGNLTVGHGYYNLVMRGKASRPTYNGANVALVSDVVEAANGSLKVTLSGTSVDKTLAQIETALNAGRHVYMVENDGPVYQLSMHMAGMMACFTSVVATSNTQVTVNTVIVYDGMAPTILTKTI